MVEEQATSACLPPCCLPAWSSKERLPPGQVPGQASATGRGNASLVSSRCEDDVKASSGDGARASPTRKPAPSQLPASSQPAASGIRAAGFRPSPMGLADLPRMLTEHSRLRALPRPRQGQGDKTDGQSEFERRRVDASLSRPILPPAARCLATLSLACMSEQPLETSQSIAAAGRASQGANLPLCVDRARGHHCPVRSKPASGHDLSQTLLPFHQSPLLHLLHTGFWVEVALPHSQIPFEFRAPAGQRDMEKGRFPRWKARDCPPFGAVIFDSLGYGGRRSLGRRTHAILAPQPGSNEPPSRSLCPEPEARMLVGSPPSESSKGCATQSLARANDSRTASRGPPAPGASWPGAGRMADPTACVRPRWAPTARVASLEAPSRRRCRNHCPRVPGTCARVLHYLLGRPDRAVARRTWANPLDSGEPDLFAGRNRLPRTPPGGQSQ
ncbi:hypothetical protein CDD83_6121 [Cordyceps sp. RAO-2017]|nr:hypothetical protein CDD83_6121 [Cordyceps sp. RAO-2017]